MCLVDIYVNNLVASLAKGPTKSGLATSDGAVSKLVYAKSGKSALCISLAVPVRNGYNAVSSVDVILSIVLASKLVTVCSDGENDLILNASLLISEGVGLSTGLGTSGSYRLKAVVLSIKLRKSVLNDLVAVYAETGKLTLNSLRSGSYNGPVVGLVVNSLGGVVFHSVATFAVATEYTAVSPKVLAGSGYRLPLSPVATKCFTFVLALAVKSTNKALFALECSLITSSGIVYSTPNVVELVTNKCVTAKVTRLDYLTSFGLGVVLVDYVLAFRGLDLNDLRNFIYGPLVLAVFNSSIVAVGASRTLSCNASICAVNEPVAILTNVRSRVFALISATSNKNGTDHEAKSNNCDQFNNVLHCFRILL